MEWTSRSRVVAAINHQEPDRVPIDITMELDAYQALKQHLGIDVDETPAPDNMMEVTVHPRILRALGADIIPVKLSRPRGWQAPPSSDGTRTDEWGVVRRNVPVPGGGSYMETVHSPLAGATLADLRCYPWPDPAAPGRTDGLRNRAAALYEENLAVMGRFGGSILEMGAHLLGWEEFLLRTALDPEFVGEFLDRVCDIQIALDELGLRAAGRYIQIFKASGEDLGGQGGPLVSRRTFDRLIKPRLCRRWRAARKVLDEVNPACKIMLHTCGSVRRFIPDFIECGIDILDPLQPRAAEMDAFELKRDYGDDLVFHGGVDIQQVLPFGSPQDVFAEVRRRICAYGPGGGYILAAAHNLQADVPPANVVAMCLAGLEYGRYPISSKRRM